MCITAEKDTLNELTFELIESEIVQVKYVFEILPILYFMDNSKLYTSTFPEQS